jgi:hypothetical protein
MGESKKFSLETMTLKLVASKAFRSGVVLLRYQLTDRQCYKCYKIEDRLRG